LLPPRLPSALVERPHLLEWLDAALESKLTLLVAPTGYGKTTIVNQWIHERQSRGWPRSAAWVSLDSGDNDLYHFWRYLIAACQTFQEELGQTALASLSDSFQPPFTSPLLETSLTLLLNDLAQQGQGGLLVVDDYHVIEEPAIHETLTFFLDHLPSMFCVLLLTRAEPRTLPLLRWRARGELAELHEVDLRFSLEETAAFMHRAFLVPLSEAALKHLDTSLQGWIAGLRLLMLTLPRQMNSHAVEQALASLDRYTDSPSPYQPLLDYFVEEIFNAQPEDVQRFLLQTSVLSHLSGPLCAAVTGEEESTAQLETLEQAGLFLEALDGTWYRFHTLFSEAMYREATHRVGEEKLRALSLRASFWYEQHAMAAEAVEAALLAHEFERAAALIEQLDMDGLISELHMVRRWLEQMPNAVLRAHPLLCWLGALSFLAPQEGDFMPERENPQVEALLHLAEDGWLHRNDSASLGLIPALRAMRAWRWGQFAHAMEDAKQALVRLPSDWQDRSIQIFRCICLFIVATGVMHEGHFGDARSYFLEAYACSLAAGDRHITRSMLLLAGVCSYALGELHQAHEHYQFVLSDARKQEDREIIAQALLGLASISFAWNKLSEAEQQANEALAFAREEDADQINSAAFQCALLAYARGQITSAQQQFAMLVVRLQATATPQAAQMLPTVLAWQARLFLEMGELQNALRILEMHELEEHMTARIVQARLRLAQGKPQEARQWLEHLLPEAIEQWQTHEALEIRVLLSLAYATCQEVNLAQQSLQQALSQARSEGFVRPFLAEGEPLVRLLRQMMPMLREPALRSYAQTLLRAFTQPTEADVSGTAGSQGLLVEPLSVQEQRVLHLLAAGYSNREIAQELVVSVNTVKDHVKHLYRKLGVSNRLQAVAAARQLKLA
jgi:LuxR family maltose regulon positive regulatory protein